MKHVSNIRHLQNILDPWNIQIQATRLNISWMAVELPAKLTAIFRPFGGMSHTEAWRQGCLYQWIGMMDAHSHSGTP